MIDRKFKTTKTQDYPTNPSIEKKRRKEAFDLDSDTINKKKADV